MTIDELERRLQAAGRAPVPEPRADFADALGERLRAGVVLAPLPEAPSARRRARPFPLAVVAAAALAAVFGTTTLVNRGALHREVRVATASDALAVLPDGTVDGVAAGQLMPDGTRIVTGDEGRVVAGSVEIGPNQEAVVSGGEVWSTPPPAPPTTTPAPTVSSPPATKPKPPSTSHPATPAPAPSVQPAPPSPAVVPASPEPAAAPTTAGSGEHRAKPTTTTTTTKPQPPPAGMRLAAWYKDRLVYLTWTSYSGPDFAACVVLRSDAPFEPGYPDDGHTSVIARIEDPGANHAFDNFDQPDRALYRVVAVDKYRRPLAQSPAAQPQLVRSQQKTTSP